jgi:hypothetical protein
MGFTVQERCDGTLTKVRKGRAIVTVSHGRRSRSVTVEAGHGYLAKARFLAAKLAAHP